MPTNVISITDGQILLRPELFYSGIRPAMDVGASVSRVSAAKTKAMRAVSRTLKGDMSRYNEFKAFAQFGTSDLDQATRDLLNHGEKLVEVLKQDQFSPLSLGEQVVSLYAANTGLMDDLPTAAVQRFEKELLTNMRTVHWSILEEINKSQAFSDETKAKVQEAVAKFKSTFRA